jgi:opacity protein-like surface antigen
MEGKMKATMGVLLMTLFTICFSETVSGELAAGVIEIGGFSSVNNYNADGGGMDVTFLSLESMVNFFLSDFLSVGLNLDIQDIDSDANDDLSIYGIALRSDYYFSTNMSTIPFVGIRLGLKGYEVGDTDNSEFAYGAHGGVKLQVAENTFVNFEGVYERFKIGGDDIDRLALMAGISFTF